jgi:2-(3-amino-3-carboxypropyl)histidine synthase
MEDDRIQVDLGIAAEIEEKHIQETVLKQPKKRFVGKRAAAEAAKSGSSTPSIEDGGVVQGVPPRAGCCHASM